MASVTYLTTPELLERLSVRDIAAMVIGHYHMLRDLQDIQLSGGRLPGGASARIELASGYQQLLRDGLDALADRDPEKVLQVAEYLDLSMELGIGNIAAQLKALARRTLSDQS